MVQHVIGVYLLDISLKYVRNFISNAHVKLLQLICHSFGQLWVIVEILHRRRHRHFIGQPKHSLIGDCFGASNLLISTSTSVRRLRRSIALWRIQCFASQVCRCKCMHCWTEWLHIRPYVVVSACFVELDAVTATAHSITHSVLH